MSEPKPRKLGHELLDPNAVHHREIWSVFRSQIGQHYPELSDLRFALIFRTTFGSNALGNETHGTVQILNAWQRALHPDVDAVFVVNSDTWGRASEQSRKGIALDMLLGVRPSLNASTGEQQKWDDGRLVWVARPAAKVQAQAIAAHGPFSSEMREIVDAAAAGQGLNNLEELRGLEDERADDDTDEDRAAVG